MDLTSSQTYENKMSQIRGCQFGFILSPHKLSEVHVIKEEVLDVPLRTPQGGAQPQPQ